MALTATFFQFSKRLNSTKVPTGGTSYPIILKEGCSVQSPVIGLKWDGSSNPSQNNMAWIGPFHRYYWITDWTYQDRIWWASLKTDVLASLKPIITQTAKYVLRAASNYDLDVIDTKYPAKAGVTYRQTTFTTGLDWNSTGSYVLAVSGANNTYSVAGTGYYVCTASQLQQILNACFNQTSAEWATVTPTSDFGEALTSFGQKWAKSAFNPFQFINSVMWLPFTPATSGSTSVKLGLIDTGVTAGILSEVEHISTASFSVNTNPGTDNGAWRVMAPFARYVLSFLPFGIFTLDSAALYGATSVDCSIKVDTLTGSGTMIVSGNNGSPSPNLVYTSAACGVPVQISGYSQNYVDMTKNAISAAGSVVSAAVTGNIAGAISAVGNAVESIAPDNYSSGSTGGKAAINSIKCLSTYKYEPVDEDITEHGRPLMKVETLGNLSGYILCADGDLPALLTPAEMQEISGYLTGGFFNE